jgi:uncharacterized heparinase superfamily protein
LTGASLLRALRQGERSGYLDMIPASMPADRAGSPQRTRGRPFAAVSLPRMRTTISSIIFRSSLYRRSVLDGPVPDEVRRRFPWHAPGDRTQAEAILGQEFVFFGRRVPFGVMPWSMLPPGPKLARAMHGFAWLGDLKANGSEEAHARARALLMGWIAANRRWSAVAWSAPAVGQRLASWLAASDFLLAGADGDERVRFLESAGRQARHLARVAGNLSGTADAFAVASGEIAAALCLAAVPLSPALRRLEREIALQILPDGGHVQRNPALHVDVFRQLLDIRLALSDAGEPQPEWLTGAVERMAPMLRALRHGDGRLALFHGAKEGDRTLSDSLLAASKVTAPARASAPEVGFERLSAGRTLVIVDVGPPLVGGHASPLAFEMSHGRERLVVNCGAFGGDDERWQSALRSTPAHSTLTVEDADALDVGWLGTLPMRVSSAREETEGASWLDARHDGYRRRFGLTHRRRLYLAETGADLRGEDRLEGRAGRRFQLRFHLHPDVRATLAEDRASVSLRTASGIGWRFLALGGSLGFDESTYLGGSDQPRRCQQIVVTGTTQKDDTRVKWAFRNESAP